MTDWLPWGGALMVGTLATLHFALRALEAKMPDDDNVRKARIAYWVTAVLSLFTYALYLVFQENWLPYS
jgi:hypothetical protein